MAADIYTIEIDQSAITRAPDFPRSTEWWRRFLPVWFSEPRWWENSDADLTNGKVNVDEDSGVVVVEAQNRKHASSIVTYLRTGVLARYIPESAIKWHKRPCNRDLDSVATTSRDARSLAAQYEAIADLRGSMDDGYDDERVNRVLGRISEVSGLRIVCVWDYYDASGVGGNSDFYVNIDGQFHDCAGDLWRWLNGSTGDPDTPAVPGPPASWVGAPTDLRDDQLRYDDGGHNYAIQDDVAGDVTAR